MIKIHEFFGFKSLTSGNRGQNVRHNGTYLCISSTNYLLDKEMIKFLYEEHDVVLIEDILPMIEKCVKDNKFTKLHICLYQDDTDENFEDLIVFCSPILNNRIKKIKGVIKSQVKDPVT